jgi:hypothetical protein
MTTSTAADDIVVSELQGKLDIWFHYGVLWERAHWLFGILGVMFSGMGAAANLWPRSVTSIFAIITTICFGFLGFANPQRQSARYMRAYRIVDTALREYRCNLRTVEDLLKEHRRAEELLNDVETSVKHQPGGTGG